MANIRTYENDVNAPKPDERIAEGKAQSAIASGNSIKQVGNDIGKGVSDLGQAYVKHQEQEELSRGLASGAEVYQNTTTAWDVARNNADPNDPSTAERFRAEQVDPIVDAWQSTFHTEAGKAWAAQHGAALKEHFFEVTTADQSTLAGAAAQQNIETFADGMSNTLLQDPSGLTLALHTADTAIDAIVTGNPNLSAAQAAQLRADLRPKLRESFVKSAFIGMARANPKAAQQALQDGFGSTDLNAEQRNEMFGFAESLDRAYKADDRAAQADAERAQKKVLDAQAAKITATLIQPDGSLAVGPGYFAAAQEYLLAGGDSSEGRAMINAGTSIIQDGGKAVTDPATYQDFVSRMQLDPTNPHALTMAQIYQARADGKMSDKDFTFFKQSRDDLADPDKSPAKKDFLKYVDSYKGYITKSSLMKADAFGDQRFYEFSAWANDYRQRAIAGGATEAQVREGIRGHLPEFIPTQAQTRAYLSQQARGTLAPLPPIARALPGARQSAGPAAPAAAPASAAPPANTGMSAARMKELDDIANGRK